MRKTPNLQVERYRVRTGMGTSRLDGNNGASGGAKPRPKGSKKRR